MKNDKLKYKQLLMELEIWLMISYKINNFEHIEYSVSIYTFLNTCFFFFFINLQCT